MPFKSLPAAGVYAITDDRMSRDDLLTTAQTALAAGVRLLQYRRKDGRSNLAEAQALQALCQQYNVPLIINDAVELAAELNCGVHLGQNDDAISEVRQRLPQHIIGASCYNDPSRAKALIAAGADYVAFGAVYPSSTKPAAPRADLATIKTASQALPDSPIVAIGGINTNNAEPVVDSGTHWLAMISGLWNHAEGITAAVHTINALYAHSAKS